jgi:hypothetical protein
MAKPQNIDFARRRFNTYGDELTITSESTGAVIDIASSTFIMYVTATKTPDSLAPADVVYSITGTVLDGPAGRVEFAPTLLQATQPDGTLYHEVVMTDTALRTRTVATGKYVYF